MLLAPPLLLMITAGRLKLQFSSFPSSSSSSLQRCFSSPAHYRACSSALSPDEYDIPLDESTLIWRKHQLGFATDEEMQTFFKRRGKRACELSDTFSHLIGPRFNLIDGLERFRAEVDEVDVVWDDDDDDDNEISVKDLNKNECDKLLKAGDCVEEVFNQSLHELGRNALRCLCEGQGRLVEGIPHFVEDVKERRLLIPKHSKVALDSSLMVYLLQPVGTFHVLKKESLLSRFLKACFSQPEGTAFAQKKEMLLCVFSKPFFFVVSEFSISVEIPTGMLGWKSPEPTAEEREKLCAAWKSFLDFSTQYATVVYGERGFASHENLLHLFKCNFEVQCSTWRGKVLLDSIGPDVHLMLIGNHRYHGKTFRAIREGTMRTILLWCPFLQDIVYYHQDGTVAVPQSSL